MQLTIQYIDYKRQGFKYTIKKLGPHCSRDSGFIERYSHEEFARQESLVYSIFIVPCKEAQSLQSIGPPLCSECICSPWQTNHRTAKLSLRSVINLMWISLWLQSRRLLKLQNSSVLNDILLSWYILYSEWTLTNCHCIYEVIDIYVPFCAKFINVSIASSSGSRIHIPNNG